jgi:hypothetical protein
MLTVVLSPKLKGFNQPILAARPSSKPYIAYMIIFLKRLVYIISQLYTSHYVFNNLKVRMFVDILTDNFNFDSTCLMRLPISGRVRSIGNDNITRMDAFTWIWTRNFTVCMNFKSCLSFHLIKKWYFNVNNTYI